MQEEIGNLQEEKNINFWLKTFQFLKQRQVQIKDKLNNIKQDEIDSNTDHLNLNRKINYKNFNSQQLMDRGDKILNEDDMALKKIKKKMTMGVEKLKNINNEMYRQSNQMNQIDKDLKETDYKMSRAGKNIKKMEGMV